MGVFKDWLAEWEYIGGVEPERQEPVARPPQVDPHPAVNIKAGSTQGKLAKLITDLGRVDPQRAQWFAKLVSMPGNASKLDRLTAQITTVQDLLRLINKLEQQQRKP